MRIKHHNIDQHVYPTLEECLEVARLSISTKKLTEGERHCIGTVWAHIEAKLGIKDKTILSD